MGVKMTEKKQKKSKKKENTAEITALLKKVQADFENYQKRIEKEKEAFTDYAEQASVKDLLPVLDSFELALKHSQNKDIEAIYIQLFNLLESKGLEKIEALDKKFDPYFHEALLQEESDQEPDTVIEEMQTGYKFKDNVIRTSKVKIAKK